MGGEIELMMDSNGRPQILFIDKGGKQINEEGEANVSIFDRRSEVRISFEETKKSPRFVSGGFSFTKLKTFMR